MDSHFIPLVQTKGEGGGKTLKKRKRKEKRREGCIITFLQIRSPYHPPWPLELLLEGRKIKKYIEGKGKGGGTAFKGQGFP